MTISAPTSPSITVRPDREKVASPWRRWRALLAKDLRVFRTPTLALILVGLLVYVSGAVLIASDSRLSARAPAERWLRDFQQIPLLAIALTALVAAAFGGVALAGERADRTALFTAMLPVSRLQIVMSKLIASLLIVGGTVALHLAVSFASLVGFARYMNAVPRPVGPTTWPYTGHWPPISVWQLAEKQYFFTPLPAMLAMVFCCFAVAWFFGSFLRSPAISACASIAITVGVPFFVMLYLDANGPRSAEIPWWRARSDLLFAMMAGVIGAGAFVAGTFVALRRVEP